MRVWKCDLCRKEVAFEKDFRYLTIDVSELKEPLPHEVALTYQGRLMKKIELCRDCRDKILRMFSGEQNAI